RGGDDLEPLLAVQLLVLAGLIVAPPDLAAHVPIEDALRDLEILLQVPVDRRREAAMEAEENRTRVKKEHDGERGREPEREADPQAFRLERRDHGPSSLRMNPTPRTVWISLTGKSWSTLFLRRAM